METPTKAIPLINVSVGLFLLVAEINPVLVPKKVAINIDKIAISNVLGNLSTMSAQPQSTSSLISHFPSRVPPHGPLRRDLEQRAMGQMPPVR